MLLDWRGQTLLLRPVGADDEAFVYATWLQSYRARNPQLERARYFASQRRRVDRLWRTTVAACSPNEPITIHAWACGGAGRLHYVYVPPELRDKGLARALVRQVCGPELEFSHRWPHERLPRGWRFNEYLLEDT